MSKLHKVEMFILDVDDGFKDVDDIVEYLRCLKYSPHIRVIESETKEFEWDDDVIVNRSSCTNKEYEDFFDKL